MSPIQSLTNAILSLLSIAAFTTALNVQQCNGGKQHGYWGSPLANSPNHGDVVTQTYCFCQRPKDQRTADPDDKDLGTMIQIEYYNKDADTTFALCHRKLCHHSNQEEQVNNCFMRETETGIMGDLRYWDGNAEPLQRNWPVVVHPDVRNYFSFIANTHKFGNERHQKANFMTFNRVPRNLGPLGGQNYRKIDNAVQDVCALQCKDFLNMEVATAEGSMQPSFQILNDVDNICPRSGCLYP